MSLVIIIKRILLSWRRECRACVDFRSGESKIAHRRSANGGPLVSASEGKDCVTSAQAAVSERAQPPGCFLPRCVCRGVWLDTNPNRAAEPYLWANYSSAKETDFYRRGKTQRQRRTERKALPAHHLLEDCEVIKATLTLPLSVTVNPADGELNAQGHGRAVGVWRSRPRARLLYGRGRGGSSLQTSLGGEMMRGGTAAVNDSSLLHLVSY